MRQLMLRISLFLVLTAASGAAWSADLPAVLDWDRRLALATPVSGVIESVMVRPGQRVAAGTTLLQLDRRLLQAQLEQAEAQRNRTRHRLDEARRELERTRELYERTLLSVHDLQLAELAAAEAEALYQSARAAETEARVQLEYARISAPFEALVVAVQAQAGETVVNRLEARTLVVIAPAGQMRARAWVGGAELAGLEPGAAATVVIDGQSLPGEVALVGLEPEKGQADTPLYQLEVRFEAPRERPLRPGQAVSIRIGE